MKTCLFCFYIGISVVEHAVGVLDWVRENKSCLAEAARLHSRWELIIWPPALLNYLNRVRDFWQYFNIFWLLAQPKIAKKNRDQVGR